MRSQDPEKSKGDESKLPFIPPNSTYTTHQIGHGVRWPGVAERLKNPTGPWKAQVQGNAGSECFEISVVNTAKITGAQKHYGWFDEDKLLITHNGGPCRDPLTQRVWDKVVKVAHEVAEELNRETIGP